MTEWWRGAVTYQVYPRSFQDDNGDGVGDLKGITRRLDHIAELGCDAVWLSPFFTSPMKDMGYDVSDYRNVDPVFGTLQDFDALVARAHVLGLKVIIDQVLNHSSDKHPFFAESRKDRTNSKADWYVWHDPNHDGTPPNNWQSVFGGSAWTWDARRKQYYFHNFLTEQPDFNFHNPDVVDWHEENLRFWLDRGVDGFRFDTVNFFYHDAKLRSDPADYRVKDKAPGNPYEMQYHIFSKNQPENLLWMERIRRIMDDYPGTATVGEMGESHHAIRMMGEYTAPGRLHQCYSFEMMGYDYSPSFFRGKIEEFFKGAPDGWPMWAFSNHDVVRHATRWAKHGLSQDALARQAGALILSFQGSICLWQGEELGQTDTELALEELTDPQGINFWPEPVGRDNTRTPMVWDGSANGGFTGGNGAPWLPVKAPQLARNVAAQAGVAGSVLESYREMLAFRRATPALRGAAATRFLDLPDPVLGFVRGTGDEAVVCLFNLSPGSLRLTATGLGDQIGPRQAAALKGGVLELGPNAVAFFRVDGEVGLG
ncbi:MAG: alpha glucosidase [Rhodobacteraceae bacterium]|nr:alpha glucosidase [Paracoccaceae bacterium]